MNIDFHVKEVGAETFTVTLHIATLKGLETLMDFLVSQAVRKPSRRTNEQSS